MKKPVAIMIAVSLCLCMLLAGCSSKSGGYVKDEVNYGSDYGSPSYDGASPAQQGDSPASDALSDRKVIKNAELSIQTMEFDEFVASVNARINELGGYVQSSEVNGRSYYSGKSMRSASITARIPADRLDEFLAAVNETGNVTSMSQGVNDVTEKYVDTEARLASLRTEYDTLLGLLSKAEDLDEIIKLQDRLSDVRYEIESYESALRSYDSLIDLSTVTMRINEVERETAVEEESFGEEASRRFGESLEDLGDALRSFALWFIGNLPVIIAVLAVFVALPLIIIALCRRSAKKRAARRRLLAEAEHAERSAAENEAQ